MTYKKKSAAPGWELRSMIIVELLDYSSTAACAAARRAMGTRNGEQLA